MECHDVLEAAVASLSGERADLPASEIDRHLGDCASCQAEVEALEETWSRLGDDLAAVPSPELRAETLERLEEAVLRRRVKEFRPSRAVRLLTQVVAALVAGGAGFFAARATSHGPAPSGGSATAPTVSLASARTIDVSRTVPDLTPGTRLANVSYRPADPVGRLGISFDVTTRYTLVGRPEEKGIANVLAYLVASGGETEGARGKAIDLVSQHYGGGATPSPEIVKVLVATLQGDKNPGVRKKAAEALAQLPPTQEIRDGFVAALNSDSNPAIRILAVEGLAKAATALKDETTIKTLRDKAGDEKENGYIRGQAALALNRIKLL